MVVSIDVTISRNISACIHGNVTIVRGEISVCCNIFRCIDIYIVVRFYVTGIYITSAGVERCITSLCSNIAVGVDIAFSVGCYIFERFGLTINRNFAACIQSNVSIIRGEISVCINILLCIDVYFIIGCYVTASCNGTLLRIDAYLISCIQSNSVCRGNIAIGRNRNITGMLIIILRGINSGINGNLAGICLVVFNQDIALDMRISNSNQQIIRRTVKPGYAINHQAAACVLTLNR